MLFPDVAVADLGSHEGSIAVEALLWTDLRLHLCMPMRIYSLFSPRSSSDNKSLPIQIPRSSMPDTFIDLLTHSILTLALSTLSLAIFQVRHTNIREVDFLLKLSRALPRADGEVSGEEHVHEVLELVGDLEAEALAHHHVPGWSEPIDEEVFKT